MIQISVLRTSRCLYVAPKLLLDHARGNRNRRGLCPSTHRERGEHRVRIRLFGVDVERRTQKPNDIRTIRDGYMNQYGVENEILSHSAPGVRRHP